MRSWSLGGGFQVSLADLDQRRAGDLLGQEQAGHLILIGTERYQYVLQRALALARGEPVHDDRTAEIVLDLPAYVPADFIPEPDIRLEIYRRLGRLETRAEVDEAREDLKDRFGTLPPEFEGLLAVTRLRGLCLNHGIAAVNAGPAAVAMRPMPRVRDAVLTLGGASPAEERVILPIAETSPAARLRRVIAALEQLNGVTGGKLGGECGRPSE